MANAWHKSMNPVLPHNCVRRLADARLARANASYPMHGKAPRRAYAGTYLDVLIGRCVLRRMLLVPYREKRIAALRFGVRNTAPAPSDKWMESRGASLGRQRIVPLPDVVRRKDYARQKKERA